MEEYDEVSIVLAGQFPSRALDILVVLFSNFIVISVRNFLVRTIGVRACVVKACACDDIIDLRLLAAWHDLFIYYEQLPYRRPTCR